MGEKIGSFYWEIDADTSKFNRGAKKTEKDVTGLGKSFTGLGKIVTTAFVATAVLGIAKVSKQLILAASDAEETQNKFNVVFSSISDSAEDAAANLSENFGLSSNAARTLLSDTGDLLTGFGFTQESALNLSDQVNQLAVDLASFTNFSGGAEGASQALTKALLGERESVKALGISILETDVQAKVLELSQQGLTFETERQAKAFATLKIAQDQSKNAIGDFARSQDSFANQSRIAQAAVDDLKVELGTGLLPIATDIVGIFGDATTAFKDYVKELNNYNRESEAAETLTGAIEDQIAGLVEKNRLLSDTLRNSMLDWQGQGFSDDQIKTNVAYYRAQIQANQELIDGLRLEEKIRSALQDEADAQAQAEAELALEQQRQRDELAEYLKLVEGAYAETQQGKIDAITEEIELWEMYAETAVNTAPQVQAILQMLREEYEALTQETIENGQTTQEVNDLIIQALEDRLERMTAIAIQEREIRRASFEFEKEVSYASVALASTTFGAISSIVGLYGDQNKKAAIAAKAFAIAEGTVNTGLAFTKTLVDGGPFPLNAINAAAILASGTAQVVSIAATPIPSFETGGIVPGTSFSGDNVRANVNSGEMILTRNDQENLLKQIRTGNTGAQSIVLQLPDNTSVKWIVDRINSGSGGVIQGRVVK